MNDPCSAFPLMHAQVDGQRLLRLYEFFAEQGWVTSD